MSQTVLLTGGYGGIGNYMTKVFEEKGWKVIRFHSSQMDLLNINTQNIGSFRDYFNSPINVVIHMAYTKNASKDIKITRNVLSLLKKETFVYMSSWVSKENDMESTFLDSYTKSKLFCERLVLSKIPKAIIIRPSIVLGKGLLWQTLLLRCGKIDENAMISVIHARILCQNIYNILDKPGPIVSDQLGECVPIRDVARRLSNIHDQPIRNVPKWIMTFISTVLKRLSSFRFLQKPCTLKMSHPIPQWLQECWKEERIYVPDSLQELQYVCRMEISGRGSGNRNTRLDSLKRETVSEQSLICMKSFDRVLKIGRDICLVESGCSLLNLTRILSLNGFALATLPEFMNVSVGACFATPIHGSSITHSHLGQLIRGVFIYYDGRWLFLKSTDETFKRLIFNPNERYVLYALYIQIIPQFTLEKRLYFRREFQDAATIPQILVSSFSTTVQWFVKEKRILVWKTEKSTKPLNFLKDIFPRRRYNYATALLLQKRLIRGYSHDILGTWTRLYPYERWLMNRSDVKVIEIIVPVSQFQQLYSSLVKYRDSISLVGFRCSPPNASDFEHDPTTNTSELLLWIDVATKNLELADYLVSKHKHHVGKYH